MRCRLAARRRRLWLRFDESGRGIERVVLARAVQRRLEDRILLHDNKTIVFSWPDVGLRT
jgi:formyltetrahydrofolate hydrolase